jgi:hypothetical protein
MALSIPRLITDDGKAMQSPSVNIVETIPSHIAYLKTNLRAEDEAEILRFGVTVPHALWHSYKYSLIRKTALIDGVIAACWGIHGGLLGSKAQPWLLTTSTVRKVSPLKFVQIYQKEVAEMLKIFQRLENMVDSEYTAAVRLLEIIGFTVEKPEKINNGMYRKFWMEK